MFGWCLVFCLNSNQIFDIHVITKYVHKFIGCFKSIQLIQRDRTSCCVSCENHKIELPNDNVNSAVIISIDNNVILKIKQIKRN